MNILICDDNIPYARVLKTKIAEMLAGLSIEADIIIFQTLNELKVHLNSNKKVDVLFLDIMFGEESSIDWYLKNAFSNIKVIFMTSYPEEAYNISEIKNAVFMVKARTDEVYLKKLLLRAISETVNKNSNLINIKVGNIYYAISLNDIIYVESQKNNIFIHTSKETIKMRKAISKFYKELPVNFLRIHKSYIINMNYVTHFQLDRFTLKNDIEIYINPKKYKELKDKYLNYIKLLE